MNQTHFNHYPHRHGWADMCDMQEWRRIKANTIAGAVALLAFAAVLFTVAV